jgi:hypothetical protein
MEEHKCSRSGSTQKNHKRSVLHLSFITDGMIFITLKILIVLVLVLGVLCQLWILPNLAQECARDAPEFAYLRYPYLVASIIIIGCFELVMVSIWHLVTLVTDSTVFNVRSFRSVDCMIVSGFVATAVTAVLLIHALAVGIGPFIVIMVLVAAVIVELGFTLLIMVMKSLLLAAIMQSDELETVI